MTTPEDREPTPEEMTEAFESQILWMKELVRDAVAQGHGEFVSPIVILLMTKTPKFDEGGPLNFQSFKPGEALTSGEKPTPVKVALFSPTTLTPPGLPKMPKNIFWAVMKLLSLRTGAFATIVGMEAWVAHAKTREEAEKVPASLADYEGRQEAIVVTAERAGEYRLYQALMKREGDALTFEDWSESITDKTKLATSRYERIALEDPVNDDPKPQAVLSGVVYRSVSANLKN